MNHLYSLLKSGVFALLSLLLTFGSARAQTAGAIDLSFNPTDVGYGQGNGFEAIPSYMYGANQVVAQADGKLIVFGSFNYYAGVPRKYLARINTDGTPDLTFDTGTIYHYGSGGSCEIALQPDGKILIGGIYTYNGSSHEGVRRLNSDGTLDPSFYIGTGSGTMTSPNYGGGQIVTIRLQPDGKILVGGKFDYYNGLPYSGLVRLNPDGTVDPTFTDSGIVGPVIGGITMPKRVHTTLVQPDGKIIVGGVFGSISGINRRAIARLHPNGTLDTSFDPGTGFFNTPQPEYSIVKKLALLPDGRILALGLFDHFNGVARNSFACLNTDGSLDASFPSGFTPGSYTIPGQGFSLQDVKVQVDGNIMLTGYFGQYAGVTRYGAVRLFPNGTVDPSFNPGTGVKGTLFGIADHVQLPDGRYVFVGDFQSYNNTAAQCIVRTSSTGAMDLNFIPSSGADPDVRKIIVQPDGKILIAGGLKSYNNVSRSGVARVLTDGTLDTSFDPGTGVDYTVNAMVRQPDGKVIIGGSFLQYNGITRNQLARVNTDGSLDLSFDPAGGTSSLSGYYTGEIMALALQPDGKILVGGDFYNFNGVTVNQIARLNPDGTRDATFSSGTGVEIVYPPDFVNEPGWINEITVQPDGKILIGGRFNLYNGTAMNHLARLNPDGTLDTGFTPGAGPNYEVNAITLQPDGKILIGGIFTTYNGAGRNRITRLLVNGTLDAGFTIGVGASSSVSDIVLQPDGKILIGGSFASYSGVTRKGIARLNTDGTPDPSFVTGSAGANGPVSTIAIQTDSKILIGGYFTVYQTTGRNRLARLHGNGLGNLTTGNPASLNLVRGATISVPFTTSATYNSGNVFKAQLSNQNGSFTVSTPVVIGTLTGTTSGSITCTIPAAQALGTAYRIRVIATSPVVTGTDNGTNLSLLLPPAMPGSITGKLTAVCPNTTQNYSIAPVSGATNYNWTAPTGAAITSGQGTTSVTVSFYSNFTSGKLSVSASNSGGGSSTRMAAISSVVLSPGAISGLNTGVCAGTVKSYSIVPVTGATFYNWTAPSGAGITSGQGSTSVTVSFGSGFSAGKLLVTASNSCGASMVRSLPIYSTPVTPGLISGPGTVCKNQASVTYSVAAVAGATSYVWTAPTGVTITSGQGTISLTVTYGAATGAMSLKVKAGNGCGLSVARALAITVNACGREMAAAEQEQDAAFEVYPNPSNGRFTVNYSALTSASSQLTLFDLTGRLVKQHSVQVAKGSNAFEVEAATLPKGVYLLELTSENEVQRQRVVIE